MLKKRDREVLTEIKVRLNEINLAQGWRDEAWDVLERLAAADERVDAKPTYDDSDPGDCPELNMSNYNHDDVADLNAWAIQADACIDRLTRERNEFHTQAQHAQQDIRDAHAAMDVVGFPRLQPSNLPYSLVGRVACRNPSWRAGDAPAEPHMRSVPWQFFIDMDSYLRHIECFGSAGGKLVAEEIRKLGNQWLSASPADAPAEPTRQQINQWMADVGWQNSAIRQADLDGVERVVRMALVAIASPADAPQPVKAAEPLNIHLLWREACKEWGEAVSGPLEYEIFAEKLLRAASPSSAASASPATQRLWMTVEDVLRIVDANTTRQEIERALIANLPSNGGPSPAVASEPSQIRELIEDLCSAAVSYGERDTKDAENAYYAAKAILIGATRAASPAVVQSSEAIEYCSYPTGDCVFLCKKERE